MSSREEGRSTGAAPSAGLGRLSEADQQLVARLLSDPTYFPVEFRTWLKSFVEGADIRITAGQIVGGGGSNVATGLPAGIILPVGAAGAIPVDALVCDGSVKVRADYLTLFNVIGVAWGAGDGTTTFNLPDLRDRALYGQGGKVAVGQTDGVAYGARGGPDHHHAFGQTSQTDGTHSHSISGSTNDPGNHDHGPTSGFFAHTDGVTNPVAAGSGMFRVNNYGSRTAGAGAHTHSVSGSAASGGAHSHFVSGDTTGGYTQDRPSFAGVIYVITTGG